MTGDSALELLFPELQRHILLQLDTLESLHALILSSSRFYQVFQLNKEICLSTIVHRQLPSSAAQDALAIEKLSQPRRTQLPRDTVLAFFSFTVEERRKLQNSVLSLPVSIKLYKLDKTIKFFINDYTQNTFPILDQIRTFGEIDIKTEYEQNCHASHLELSKQELKRLKRAFCRFETYRKLFARCSSDFNHDLQRCSRKPSFSVFEQGKLFFQHTPMYQVAEVACVRDYFFRRLRGVFNQVEDEATTSLKAEFPNPKDKEQAMDWDDRTGGRYRYFHWDEGHYFTYGGKYEQDHHIEHLLSLGLPYIRRILESSGRERRDLLLRDACGCSVQRETKFLTAALGLDDIFTTDERYQRHERGLNACTDEEGVSNLPPAWLWAHADGYFIGLVNKHSKGLRDWGYVFWDMERLQESGVLSRDPHELSKIKFDEFEASLGLSVQERWMGPQPEIPYPESYDGYPVYEEMRGEEVEGEEAEEGEEVVEPEEGKIVETDHERGGEDARYLEDSGASHGLLSTIATAFKWLWSTGIAMLKRVGMGLRQQFSECYQIIPLCRKDRQD